MYKVEKEPSTLIMKVGARLDETRIFLRNVDLLDDLKLQKEKVWNEQWFGFLSEEMTERLVYANYQRFTQFPDLIQVIKNWMNKGLENHDFKLICHFHIQLSDPFYRWATGDYFYERYKDGFDDISSPILTKKLEEQFKNLKTLTTQSYNRISRGILSSARDTGILKGKADKSFNTPLVSIEFLGYVIYSLQKFDFPFSELPNSPYIKSILKDESQFKRLLVEGQRKNWWEFNWDQGLFTLYPKFDGIEKWYEESI